MVAIKNKSIIVFLLLTISVYSQNVIIVVIDGARYSETFGAGDKYIHHLYNDLKPQGALFTNFRIADEGETSTNPGQASILTGTWQLIKNDGTERPNRPTIFEYYRKNHFAKSTDCFIVAGKKKISALSYSTYPGFGENFGASTCCFDAEDDNVYDSLMVKMDTYHPKLILVNFPSTDSKGHSGIWREYVNTLTNVDNLIYKLWQKIQTDPFYKNNTTLLITNDHGRHSRHFKNHGDDCYGCEHIMLLAISENIPQNQKRSDLQYQIDIAPTVGVLLGFETPFSEGKKLLKIKKNKKIN